jgi:hypothetical protein
MRRMISLNDSQLQTVMSAAADLDPEKRPLYLERVGAMLAMRRPFSDDDVVDVVSLALCGLAHK